MSVQIYPYRNRAGEIVYEVIRETGKRFKQRRPDGNGGHIWNIKDAERVPYCLPELIHGIASGETVYIVEGEKDVDRLRLLGLCATTISGGAKQNRAQMRANLPPRFAEFFAGAARVVIIGDNDKPGHVFAETIAEEVSRNA